MLKCRSIAAIIAHLSKKCNDFLNSAEKKITMLINDGGEIKEDNFVPKED